jgi:hypothetical protein
MRQPYETPEITDLGSINELTQATFHGQGTDSLSWIPIFGGLFGSKDTFS